MMKYESLRKWRENEKISLKKSIFIRIRLKECEKILTSSSRIYNNYKKRTKI